MRSGTPMLLRVGVALGGLLVVALVLLGYLGDYRVAKRHGDSPASGSESTTTPSGEATRSGEGTQGKSGTAPADASKPGQVVTVQIEGLNFRAEPKAGSTVIKGLGKGERLTWIATEDGWYKCSDSAGRVGWVSANPQYATLAKR